MSNLGMYAEIEALRAENTALNARVAETDRDAEILRALLPNTSAAADEIKTLRARVEAMEENIKSLLDSVAVRYVDIQRAEDFRCAHMRTLALTIGWDRAALSPGGTR